MPPLIDEDNGKEFLVAFLLSYTLGNLAIDRFYLGHIGTGILKLITLGGFGIWGFIDVILILTDNMYDKNGHRLKNRDSHLKIALIIIVLTFVLPVILYTIMQNMKN